MVLSVCDHPAWSYSRDRHSTCSLPWGLIIFSRRGLAPKVARKQYSELSNADKKQLLERGEGEDGLDTDRISGLGAGP